MPASWLTAPKWMSCPVGNNYFVFSLGGLFPALSFSNHHFAQSLPQMPCRSVLFFPTFFFFEVHTLWRGIDCHCHLWTKKSNGWFSWSSLCHCQQTLLKPSGSLSCNAVHTKSCCSWLQSLFSTREKTVCPDTWNYVFLFLSLKDCIADSLLKWLWTQFDSRHNLGILATWDMQMWFFCLVLTLPKPLILIIHLVQCFYSHSLPIKSCFILNSPLFLSKGLLSSYVREEGTTH